MHKSMRPQPTCSKSTASSALVGTLTMRDRRGLAFVWLIAALLLLLALSVIPTPYLLLAPGRAVDLGKRVAVAGHPSSQRHYFLTDVTVTRASALLLAAALVPGVQLVRRDELVPAGETGAQYDRVLTTAMTESQNVAAVVAERAAGYRVPEPPRQIFVQDVLPSSRAGASLQDGDALLRVQGRRIVALEDVSSVVGALPAGGDARVDVVREGRLVRALVPTIETPVGSRLGILVRTSTQRPALPVPVRYDLGDIAGSSGGLMFALQIYADLHSDARFRAAAIAGTGTIDSEGRIGRIEGTRQKLLAAKRMGAAIFLVPRENFPDVARERDVRVIPVHTFAEALSALFRAPNATAASRAARNATAAWRAAPNATGSP